MIKFKNLIEGIHNAELIYPKDILNFTYLNFIIGRHPEILQSHYGKEVVDYYLSQWKKKYINLFRELLYSQIDKYVHDVRPQSPSGRISADFDKTKFRPDASTKDLRDLMHKTFRSDMKRPNVVWNNVADYTYQLDSSTNRQDIFNTINFLNNSVHNTGGKILTDTYKVPNARELMQAFGVADKITNSNQWEILKGMVDKDLRDLLSHGEDPTPEQLAEGITGWKKLW